MKTRVLMIIAKEGFRDEEYKEPKDIFEKAGLVVTTASSSLGMAKGKLGLTAKVDITLPDVKVSDYDATVFVGGPGSYAYFDDAAAQEIAKDTLSKGKVLAAICAASSILANAGLLKGIKATCFSSEGPNLKSKGAIYTGKGLEIDGKIITADGPGNAKAFGEAIVKALK